MENRCKDDWNDLERSRTGDLQAISNADDETFGLILSVSHPPLESIVKSRKIVVCQFKLFPTQQRPWSSNTRRTLPHTESLGQFN